MEKIDKWDYIKIKTVSSPKDPIKRMKSQLLDPENPSIKGCIFTLCKESLQKNKKKYNSKQFRQNT